MKQGPATMRNLRSRQEGVMLLEALIGLLIFSLGIMALIAMQSVSVSNVSNAKYRVEAAFYADEIIHKAWLDKPNEFVNYEMPGGTNTQMFQWVTKLQSPAGLPGAGAYPPTIHIESVPSAGPPSFQQPPVSRMTVTVRWKAPDALVPSNHVAVGYISQTP
jgi:type IV pilus assembly protein PilV